MNPFTDTCSRLQYSGTVMTLYVHVSVCVSKLGHPGPLNNIVIWL